MIRINLLAEKDTKRRRRGGGGAGSSNIMALFGMVLVLEIAGLGFWYMEAETAADNSNTGQAVLRNEVGTLEAVKGLMRKVAKLDSEVNNQQQVFDELDNGKVGPLNALLYLSYALRKVDVKLDRKEYQILLTQWAPGKKDGESEWKAESNQIWNPQTVWLKSIKEKEQFVEIVGSAKRHEDVMTFLQRLRTSTYFEGIDLVYQKVQDKSDLGLPYVDFKLQCLFNFYPKGYPPLATSGGSAH
ncbi:MAG TPA: hypothetical protein EYN06_03410 [Myxococcales bacterium]|nr:hypothetical protein [Myxococcales bacterium]HIN85505.1 hypothetical protein [Myxococcales bacterium]